MSERAAHKAFGQFLRRERERCEMSQAEFAKDLGIGESYVEWYERGAMLPGLVCFAHMKLRLGFDANEALQQMNCATPVRARA